MGIVLMRGALAGEHAGAVAQEALVCLIFFAMVGWVAGWITEYLILDSVEQHFRARVQWYREALVDAGWEAQTNDGEMEDGSSNDPR